MSNITSTATAHTSRVTTKRLLTCGAIAGPIFIVVAGIQVVTREGFDVSRHALSWLSLGDLGWLQIANFIVTGLMNLAFAIGIRRALHPGRAGTWGAILIGADGAGGALSGVFSVDPCGGFPPGAVADCSTDNSWHFALHNTVSMLAFVALVAACFVFVRHFAGLGSLWMAAYSTVTGIGVIALFVWPGYDGFPVRLMLAATLMFAWTTVLAIRLQTEID
jgi:hypothetical membrane protein